MLFLTQNCVVKLIYASSRLLGKLIQIFRILNENSKIIFENRISPMKFLQITNTRKFFFQVVIASSFGPIFSIIMSSLVTLCETILSYSFQTIFSENYRLKISSWIFSKRHFQQIVALRHLNPPSFNSRNKEQSSLTSANEILRKGRGYHISYSICIRNAITRTWRQKRIK